MSKHLVSPVARARQQIPRLDGPVFPSGQGRRDLSFEGASPPLYLSGEGETGGRNEVAGALDLTAPFGITANGKVVGFYDDNNGTIHGFTLTAGNFSTVDFPGAFLTEAFRVNEVGQIVGIYNLAGQHGFLATPRSAQN